jgi:hypothetical protein
MDVPDDSDAIPEREKVEEDGRGENTDNNATLSYQVNDKATVDGQKLENNVDGGEGRPEIVDTNDDKPADIVDDENDEKAAVIVDDGNDDRDDDGNDDRVEDEEDDSGIENYRAEGEATHHENDGEKEDGNDDNVAESKEGEDCGGDDDGSEENNENDTDKRGKVFITESKADVEAGSDISDIRPRTPDWADEDGDRNEVASLSDAGETLSGKRTRFSAGSRPRPLTRSTVREEVAPGQRAVVNTPVSYLTTTDYNIDGRALESR